MRHLLDLNDLEMDIPRKIVDMAKVYKSQNKGLAQGAPLPVSYTHLTLPTNREV